MAIPEYAIESRFAAIGIEPIDGNSIMVDVLWVDRSAPPTIEIPYIGTFELPISAVGNKNSRLFFGVALSKILVN